MTAVAAPPPEPLARALVRNLLIALAAGSVFARLKGNLALLPAGTLFALWFTLGGHFAMLCQMTLRTHGHARLPLFTPMATTPSRSVDFSRCRGPLWRKLFSLLEMTSMT